MKITPAHARIQNQQLILKTIYDGNGISRAQIARETKLTRPTVSNVVANLIEDGLVEEGGLAESLGGRRGITLRVPDDARHLIGLDLARGDFRGAIINLRGEIIHRIELPLKSNDGDKAIALVYELLDQLVESTDRPLLGIGIGAPGPVDVVKGVMHHAVNLNWRDIPLRDLLQDRYQLPVYIANDCQVAALAEITFGKVGDDIRNLVLVNIGWGVGAGIVINNQLLHGPLGAGEIGHVVVEENGNLCTCGNQGCLETVASSRAIIQRAQDLAQQNPSSLLNQFSNSIEDISLDTIRQAFQNGDSDANQVVYDAGRSLGIAAANLVGILGSSRIFFAGSVTCFGDQLLEIIRIEMNKRVLPLTANATEIGFASLGSNNVLLGASALLLPDELGLL